MTDFAWPEDIVPYQVKFYLQSHTGGTESPFSGVTKVYGLSRPRWVCAIQLRAPDSADRWGGDYATWGERVDAFLAEIEGRLNRVALYDFRRPGGTVPFTNAVIAAGDEAVTLVGASTGDIRIGEYIGGDGRPHIITGLAVSGTDMVATVKPAFEKAVSAGAATFDHVTGLFRLTSDDAGANATTIGELTEYTLEFVEDTTTGATADPTAGLMQVANRTYVPNNLSGSATTAQTRTAHTARDDITSLVLGFPNWFVNVAASGAEAGSGGTKTIEASVEYPAGTFTRVQFGGSDVGAMADVATKFSDEVAVAIPAGAQFWIRAYIQCQGSGKIVYTATASAGTIAATGEGLEMPAASNKVMGGTVAAPSVAGGVYPVAILANTANKAALVIGDSRALGESGTAAMGDTGEIAPSIDVGVINAGVPSDRMAWFLASSARRRELATFVTDVIVQYGINDIRGGAASLATLQANAKAVYALFPGKTIRQSTIVVSNTSTDNFTTLANQAVSATRPVRTGFNDWLRLLFDTTVSTAEKITNGNFASGTTGWSASVGAALSVVTVGGINHLRVTNTADGLALANQSITTVVGQKYAISARLIDGTSAGVQLRIGTTAGGVEIQQLTGAGDVLTSFVATTTTTWIGVGTGATSATGQFGDFALVTTAPNLSTALAGYYEVADVVESSRNEGKWKVNGTANYLTNDGLHENQTAYTLIRDSGAVDIDGVSSGPTLGTITLSATTFNVGTPSSGTINGATAGSTITMSGLPAGLTINSAARTWAWDGTGTAGTGSITPTETLAGATNSPHASPAIGYTIAAAADGYDVILSIGDSLGEGIIPRDTAVDLNWPGMFSWGVDGGGAGYHTIRNSIPLMNVRGTNRSGTGSGNNLTPAEWFAKVYYERTGRKVLIVPMAIGGSSLVYAAPNNWSSTAAGSMLANSVSEANLAIAAAKAAFPDSQFVGTICWLLTNDSSQAAANSGTINRTSVKTALTNVIAHIRANVTGASSSWFAMAGMMPEQLHTTPGAKMPLEFAMQDVHRSVANTLYAPLPGGYYFVPADGLHPSLAGQRWMMPAIEAALHDTAPTITNAATFKLFENQNLRLELRTAAPPAGQAVMPNGTDQYASWSLSGPDAALFEVYEEFRNENGNNTTPELWRPILRFVGDATHTYASPGDANGDHNYEVTLNARSSGGRVATKALTIQLQPAYGTASSGAVTKAVTQAPISFTTVALSSAVPARYDLPFGAGLNLIYISQGFGTIGPVKVNGVSAALLLGLSAEDRQVWAVSLAEAGTFPMDLYGSSTMNNPRFMIVTLTNTLGTPTDKQKVDQGSGDVFIESKSYTPNAGGTVVGVGYGGAADTIVSPSAWLVGPSGASPHFAAARDSAGTIRVNGDFRTRALLTMQFDKAP